MSVPEAIIFDFLRGGSVMAGIRHDGRPAMERTQSTGAPAAGSLSWYQPLVLLMA